MGRLSSRIFGGLIGALLSQRGHLFPWVPVCLAVGIGLYFSLLTEPPVWVLWLCAACGVAMLVVQARMTSVAAVVFAATGLVAVGFSIAGARSQAVSGPVLDFRYYGAIEGRVVDIDRSASDAMRLTLDRVVLERMDPDETPNRVRVSLHGNQGFVSVQPDSVVILTGHLGPPGGAVEPGGFDFRRHAWFLRLGAVGYTRNPVLLLEDAGQSQAVFRTRMALSSRVQMALPGETGAFAAAVMTGDRSGMGASTLQALRASNLAHLLAISGLHMGLLAGFVFGVLRLTLLLVPHARHRWPVKRLAAGGALIAAFGYLLLSGGNVATERAFVMAAVALTAVILHRRALSLRAVAIAASIILVLHPEALLGPGFQMSFAATTALVAVFETVSRSSRTGHWPRWTAPILSLVLSSFIAGAATAPIGMAHFNQVAHYGLIANLVSVPVMGIVVVPMAVLAALLMPFGLDWVALKGMGLGLDWILGVAQTVSDWEGAVRPVSAPDAGVLPLLAFGGVVLCVWRGRGRVAGLLPAAMAVVLWVQSDRPTVLIADSGTLVGLMTEEGRALSRPRGSGFVAEVWLENDGSSLDQEQAAALWPGDGAVRRAPVGAFEIVHLQGKRAAASFPTCSADQIVVSSANITVNGDCLRFDPDLLRQTGAVSITPANGGLHIETDRSVSGNRIWHHRPKRDPVRVAKAQ